MAQRNLILLAAAHANPPPPPPARGLKPMPHPFLVEVSTQPTLRCQNSKENRHRRCVAVAVVLSSSHCTTTRLHSRSTFGGCRVVRRGMSESGGVSSRLERRSGPQNFSPEHESIVFPPCTRGSEYLLCHHR
jgi:hypothetical protein